MNKHQKQVLILCAVILLGMLLFPPFQAQVRGTVFNLGYHFLAQPPHRGSVPASVNVQMLVVQWVGVALLGAIALLLLKGPPGAGAPAAGSHQPPPDPVAPPVVDQSRTFLGGHHHPWRRYFARIMDSSIFVYLLAMAFGVMPPRTVADFSDLDRWMLFYIIANAVMIPVEAVLLSSFKTTPGKWIFGIRVTGGHGAPLSFAQAINRSFRVWVQGSWLGIPIVLIIPMVFAYGRLNRTGTTLWDAHCGAVVTHRPWTPARAIGAITATLLVWGVLPALMTQASRMPRPSVQATSGADETAMGAEASGQADEWAKYPLVDSEPSGQQLPATLATADTFEAGEAAYKRGDYVTALRVFKPLAEQGNAPAQNYLGLMYYVGQGVTTNYDEAAKWSRLAAEQGDMEAQYSLGVMYYQGQGVTTNYDEATKWIRLAAEQGYAAAQKDLGYMYEHGLRVPKDYDEAAKWYRLAAEQGDAAAQYSLGVMYKNGQGVTTNYDEAAKWYRLAAEQGFANAQSNLGLMYNNGQGVTTNYDEAAKWYRLAAEQGFAAAQFNLGLMYYVGQGVTTNYDEAAKWYRLAAEQGHAAAQSNLGVMYYQGQGVPQDYVQAHKWFNLAAAGYPASEAENRNGAVKNRDLVAEQMTPAQVAQAQQLAREWKPNQAGD